MEGLQHVQEFKVKHLGLAHDGEEIGEEKKLREKTQNGRFVKSNLKTKNWKKYPKKKPRIASGLRLRAKKRKQNQNSKFRPNTKKLILAIFLKFTFPFSKNLFPFNPTKPKYTNLPYRVRTNYTECVVKNSFDSKDFEAPQPD